jgi:hypothetical protein
MSNEIRCETCRWWGAQRPGGIAIRSGAGLCRRFPPNPQPDFTIDPFPVTFSFDWCGEHSPPASGGMVAKADRVPMIGEIPTERIARHNIDADAP